MRETTEPVSAQPGTTDDAERTSGARHRWLRRFERIDRGPGAPLVYFLIAGLASLSVVGGGAFLASRRVGIDIATDEVRQLGETLAKTIAQQHVDRGLIAGDPTAVEAFDRVITETVLSDTVVRVKLWAADGRILYSDEDELIGQRFDLEPHELEALQQGVAVASLTELDEPTNEYEREFGRLIEVYTPVAGPDEEAMLFEIYVATDGIRFHSAHIWRELIPIVVGVVIVLGLVHLPLAWRMSTRVRMNLQRRLALQLQAIEAADLEDRRIASDLHDGVVQNLAGDSYLLAAAQRSLGDENEPAQRLLDTVGKSVRNSIADLRSLIVDLYPPHRGAGGLAERLQLLLNGMETRGISTSLDVPSDLELAPEVEVLVYRVVRESLRNVEKHAAARNVSVTISSEINPRRVEITDDGKGFSVEDRPLDGHLGLRLMTDLTSALPARLDVFSAPGQGTKVRLELSA